MHMFNTITVNPQLPKRIGRLIDISNNLWWGWNTEFLQLFKMIDNELWLKSGKNPVKFFKTVEQQKLETIATNFDFLKKYDKVVANFDDYMESKNTWFKKEYPQNQDDLIAYFSAEYGLDEILPIYSGGLGILSGDHLKSASDLGLPFVAVGLLYKDGYFDQKIKADGSQESDYQCIDLYSLPILPVKTKTDDDLITYVRFGKTKVFLKVWQINVGRVNLYLLDSDIPENPEEIRPLTLRLYGGDQEMRIKQEIILGMAGTNLFNKLNIKPTIYHMNEGHSAFVTLELIRDLMETKKVSFEVAKAIASSKTIFTTHTPVPAGNDIFPLDLVEKYFKDFWGRIQLDRESFFKLGMEKNSNGLANGFNMAVLALKIAGKKNGVSKLHGEVSKELFGEIWSNIMVTEAPIEYITNGVHTCSWLGQNIKELYNKYLTPYWQDKVYKNEIWQDILNIPNDKLWKEHLIRKEKLMELVKVEIISKYKEFGKPYDEIKEVTSKLNPNALTIGFARRFATYKRAALIFSDIERITKILNNPERPVQIIFSGKAHPADKEGQDVLKQIYNISQMPQFKGKIFIVENYNIAIARYLVSGVDIWLNTPRRPMEASGTSGQKAAVNGVINFSILDGWWAEGYNGKNGWAIGTEQIYTSYDAQDRADSESIYDTLEEEIIPMYYNFNKNGFSDEWVEIMKQTIMSNAGRFSTARMVVDYAEKMYLPLCNLTKEHYQNIEEVEKFVEWEEKITANWNNIQIEQINNEEHTVANVGNKITAKCKITLPNMISVDDVLIQLYYGKILENGVVSEVSTVEMNCTVSNEKNNIYEYATEIELNTSGNYGYTFRVVPKTDMVLRQENLNLVKWIVK
ncbi:MAG: alpha-glucan family phosphorylase [Oscillospiraceae bacterium]|nr:alpha-glucan family phosphorylase [Oscillospiraceae bacterium]